MSTAENITQYFFNALLENIPEGVVFLDTSCRIHVWNAGARHLTGLGSAVIGRRLEPSLLKLKDAERFPISDSANPFELWMAQRIPATQKFFISGRSGRDAQVDVSFFPVIAKANRIIGGIAMFRDTSIQVELQRQLNDLYTIATIDPLTQVANRAEFERILGEYIEAHRAVGLHCSIIVCDIDFFKKINDNFGHHIGDQALIRFASMLKQVIRPHDFIARFGGEEFVILCANCAEGTAAQRADDIRKVVESTPLAILYGKSITASFGVAELLPDDDATSLFVRADQALLQAKNSGRNCVIRASTMKPDTDAISKSVNTKAEIHTDLAQMRPLPYQPAAFKLFAIPTILPIFIERMKSTVFEFKAKVLHASEGSLSIQVRQNDESSRLWQSALLVDIDIAEIEKSSSVAQDHPEAKLMVRIAVRPQKRLFGSANDRAAGEAMIRKLGQYLQIDNRNEVTPDARYHN